jgi:hypothetical protein
MGNAVLLGAAGSAAENGMVLQGSGWSGWGAQCVLPRRATEACKGKNGKIGPGFAGSAAPDTHSREVGRAPTPILSPRAARFGRSSHRPRWRLARRICYRLAIECSADVMHIPFNVRRSTVERLAVSLIASSSNHRVCQVLYAALLY